MSQLFEYQRKTLITILRELHTESFIVLCGEKRKRKTFLSENDCFDEKYHVIRFRAEFKNKFDDYNCIPLDIMNKFYSFSKKKQNSISLAKDVAATIANVAFISVENILETLLSSEEKDELDALLHFFIKKETAIINYSYSIIWITMIIKDCFFFIKYWELFQKSNLMILKYWFF